MASYEDMYRLVRRSNAGLRQQVNELEGELAAIVDEVVCDGGITESTPNAVGALVSTDPTAYRMVQERIRQLKDENTKEIARHDVLFSLWLKYARHRSHCNQDTEVQHPSGGASCECGYFNLMSKMDKEPLETYDAYKVMEVENKDLKNQLSAEKYHHGIEEDYCLEANQRIKELEKENAKLLEGQNAEMQKIADERDEALERQDARCGDYLREQKRAEKAEAERDSEKNKRIDNQLRAEELDEQLQETFVTVKGWQIRAEAAEKDRDEAKQDLVDWSTDAKAFDVQNDRFKTELRERAESAERACDDNLESYKIAARTRSRAEKERNKALQRAEAAESELKNTRKSGLSEAMYRERAEKAEAELAVKTTAIEVMDDQYIALLSQREKAEADQQAAQARMWDLNKRAEKAEASLEGSRRLAKSLGEMRTNWENRAIEVERKLDIVGNEGISLIGKLAVAITEKEAAEEGRDECLSIANKCRKIGGDETKRADAAEKEVKEVKSGMIRIARILECSDWNEIDFPYTNIPNIVQTKISELEAAEARAKGMETNAFDILNELNPRIAELEADLEFAVKMRSEERLDRYTKLARNLEQERNKSRHLSDALRGCVEGHDNDTALTKGQYRVVMALVGLPLSTEYSCADWKELDDRKGSKYVNDFKES